MEEINNSDELQDVLNQKTDKLLNDIVDFIHAKASEHIVKNGSVDKGALLNDVSIDKSGPAKHISWDSGYAEWIEWGSPPHWLPVQVIEEDIAAWCRRRLAVNSKESIEVAWRIAYKIAHEGTKEKPFVRPAGNEAVAYFEKVELG